MQSSELIYNNFSLLDLLILCLSFEITEYYIACFIIFRFNQLIKAAGTEVKTLLTVKHLHTTCMFNRSDETSIL